MASGAIGDYFVSDPVRELNEPQSNPGLGYKPPKREVTPDGDSGLGGGRDGRWNDASTPREL